MATARPRRLLERLRKLMAHVVMVRSAPAAALFSSMGGSIVYETSPAQIPLSDIFSIVSEDILAGQGTSDQCAAVERLYRVLDDETLAESLAERLSEVTTEHLEFINVAAYFLK